jgi:hypothetical protein
MAQHQGKFEQQAEGTALIAAGTAIAVGAGIAATVEGMGLAVGGTAIALGAAPFAIIGAVAGLAAYGLAKVFAERDDETAMKPLSCSRADDRTSSVKVSEELISSFGTFFLYANSDLPGLNPDGYDLCGEDTSEVEHS